jgi:hypothetical protein
MSKTTKTTKNNTKKTKKTNNVKVVDNVEKVQKMFVDKKDIKLTIANAVILYLQLVEKQDLKNEVMYEESKQLVNILFKHNKYTKNCFTWYKSKLNNKLIELKKV